MKLKQISQNLIKKGRKNSPTLLLVAGAGLFVATVYEVWKKSPEAHKRIDDARYKKLTSNNYTVEKALQVSDLTDVRLNPVETVRVIAPVYWRAALYGGMSMACFITGNRISNRRYAALAAAYAISESKLTEYKQKTKEIAGDKVEQQIVDELAKDRLNVDPPTEKEMRLIQDGKSLCKDSATGQYFSASMEDLKRVENELNHRLLTEMFISLNDYLSEVGAAEVSSAVGDELGWNVDNGLICFNTVHHTIDGEHYIYIDYDIGPRYNHGALL